MDSVYKLDLKRPKKSLTRNGMLNSDMLKILKELNEHTLLGTNREKYFGLMMTQIYQFKGIEVTNEDLDDIIDEIFGEDIPYGDSLK